MAKILILDDDRPFMDVMARVLYSHGHEVIGFDEVEQGIQALSEQSFDLAISDVVMQPVDGMAFLEKVHQEHPQLPVIMMTGQASVNTALQALKMGAFDFVEKPFRIDQLITLVNAGLAWSARSDVEEADPVYALEGFVANNHAVQGACTMVERLAPADTPVLFIGEDATGRRAAGRAMHRLSRRAAAEFVIVDCADGDERELENRLFGYLQSAEPDAAADLDGAFLQANGGTVFLHAVDALPMGVQEALSRAMLNKAIRPRGAPQDIAVDVRVLASTSIDLTAAVDKQQFHAELGGRLRPLSIELPPLRKRRDDILPLARHFINSSEESGGAGIRFDVDARRTLRQYGWPGNVRELAEVVRNALLNRESETLTTATLPPGMVSGVPDQPEDDARGDDDDTRGRSLRAFLQSHQADLSGKVLKNAGSADGNS